MLAQEQRPGFFVYKSTNPSNRRAFFEEANLHNLVKKRKWDEKIFLKKVRKPGYV